MASPDNDDETKKWFGAWEAILNDYNQEEYSSGLIISFSNDREDDYGVWSVKNLLGEKFCLTMIF
ncbi:hypothetical protein N9P98_00270 [Flavobacteriaceae bacterium]|nr:hypothetical protein [Flavobacteriaceae bacterium]